VNYERGKVQYASEYSPHYKPRIEGTGHHADYTKTVSIINGDRKRRRVCRERRGDFARSRGGGSDIDCKGTCGPLENSKK